MRKNFLAFVLLFVSVAGFSQSPKQVVIEHFTNTKCSICASRNPGFYSVLANYPQVIHIAYHPSAPYQNCYFNLQNKPENDARTNYYNTYATLSQQINLYEQTVSGYQTLLDAEKRRFGLGETTLLTIFMRETYLLEASIKLIELRAKIAKAQMAVWWAAGLLQ